MHLERRKVTYICTSKHSQDMKYRFHLFYLFVILTSCQNYPLEVQEALILSESNRSELEKVLEHYRYKDRIGFESACFLIGNMKYHESNNITPTDSSYYHFFNQTDSIYQMIFRKMPLDEIKTFKNKEYNSLRLKRRDLFQSIPTSSINSNFSKSDLKNIHADFLIDNIDMALRIWKKNGYTYKKDFNFFTEFILPYRTTNEYPTLNRSTISSMFHHILNDPLHHSIYSQLEYYKIYIEKCRWINKHVKVKEHLGIYDLFIPKFKMDCHNMTNWSCNIFRSCGIPAVYEFTPLWKERDSRHFWCVSPDSTGILQPYTAPDNNLKEDWESDIQYAGKVYRKTFGAQKETPYFLANQDEYIPDIFSKPLLTDQTHRYHQTVTLRIPLQITTSNRLAYLCMFTTQDILPVAWGKIDHNEKEVVFEQVPLNTLFFPICYDDDVMLGLSEPFMICSTNVISDIPLPLTTNRQTKKIIDLSIINKQLRLTYSKEKKIQNMKYITLAYDSSKYINMHLLRKYPEKRRMKTLQNRLKGAILVGSNRPNKKDLDTLLTLEKCPQPYLQDISFENEKKYRYYRFMTKDQTSVNIAHIEFLGPYSKDRENLNPTNLPIFSKKENITKKKENIYRFKGKPLNTSSHPEYAFDNDVNTYVSSSSIAVDFKTPVQITHIRFMPRTANNTIVPGNSYLLLYYHDGWKEFKTVYAENNYLDFMNVPNAKLYWLQNLTEGKDELPFFYIDGKQYFLHTDTLPNDFITNE